MAVYILRPSDPGHYSTGWHIQTSGGFVTYWENINESDQDGDANYIYTDTAGPFTVGLTDFNAGSFIRPCRIPGIVVIATVKPSTPNPANFRFRLRYCGYDYDSELFSVSSTDYVEVFKQYFQVPNGDGWNAVRLSDLEVGIVYDSGEELRCTKLEVQVYTELYPHYTLTPSDVGAHQDWEIRPSSAIPSATLRQFDGDLSYIRSSTLWTAADTVSSYTLRKVYGFSDTDIYAVGDHGTIVHYDGSLWKLEIPVTDKHLYGVWGPDPTNVWVVGQTGTILRWNGTDWLTETSGVLQDLIAVWGTSLTDVWAVGVTGTALHYDGVAWTLIPTGTVEQLFGIHGVATNNIWAVGSNGTMLWWNGIAWLVMPPVIPLHLYSIYMTSPLDAWAVGRLGTALHYNGIVWLPAASGTIDHLMGVWGSSPTNYIAVGDNGTILHNDGVVWEKLVSGSAKDLYGVWGSTPYRVWVVGQDDTILSHEDIVWWPISTFQLEDLPAVLLPPNIDKVNADCLVKNIGDDTGRASVVLRSVGTDYFGATSTSGKPIDPDDKWHLIEDVFLNDPNVGWPSGLPGSTPWLPAEVNALELGILNRGGDLRCTSMAMEIFLKNLPLANFTLVPVADGYYYVPPKTNRIDGLFPGVGESPWQDVQDDPPDFGATYISGDADAAKTPLYGTFPVTPLPAIPPGQQFYCCSHRMWVTLPPGSTGAVLAPVFRWNSETYVGRPYPVDNTGLAWFLIRNEFYTSPFTSKPWTMMEINTMEVGVVILSGQAWITSVNVDVQTAPLLQIPVLPPDPTDLQITNGAAFIMNRSLADGTIYAVTEFAVGTGGFLPAAPWTVVPVNPADTLLINEIYRAPIERIAYDADAPPWRVKYWCRVPRGVPLNQVGEVGLFATILWSPVPGETGTKFLFALQHMPCQCRHERMVQLFEVSVVYP